LGTALSGKLGKVISQITDNHAKFNTYGPKGGPYDENRIQADVDAYIVSFLP
jgi:hypothetical protein